LLQLHRDWTALAAATSAPGLRSPRTTSVPGEQTRFTAATSAPGLRRAGLCQELREEIAALQAQLASLDKQSVEREIELKREKFELKSKLEKMCALAIAAHHASCASQSVASC
jgi:hypothetical protein